MNNEKLREAIEKALEEKGKRKFLQSLELIVNFRGVDFSKPENRLSMEVQLKDRGKKNNIIFVGEEATVYELKRKMQDINAYTLSEAEKIDIAEIKKAAKHSIFYASPKIIGNVAKMWGRVLGARGKAPKPLINEKQLEQAKDMALIAIRGKNSSTVQVLIGKENQPIDVLVENANIALDAIKKKINQSNIKSIYVKLTMGKPVKVL